MKSLFGPKRRKVLGQTFLNIFTILIPAAVTSEKLIKIGVSWKISLCTGLLLVLLLGWVLTPEEKSELAEG